MERTYTTPLLDKLGGLRLVIPLVCRAGR